MPHRNGPRFRLIVVGSLWAATMLGCQGRESGPPPPSADVLLVTIDTLRGDRWGCVGDPNARTPVADRLARGGWLGPEGRAPCPVTLPSHTSMLTGLSPAVHGVRDNAIFRLEKGSGRTIAEIFHDAGWATAAFVSSFPLMSRFGLDRGFDEYDDRLGDSDEAAHLRARPANITTDAVESWLVSDDAPDPEWPLFAWVHFFDPHAEYDAPQPWPRLAPSPYDAEVAFADHELGRLLGVMRSARPDRARRIVLLADHGEGLGEFGERSHGVLLHASTIRVPVVVRDETFRPRLELRPVALESVAATLRELGGMSEELDPQAAPGFDADPPPAIHAETLYPYFNFGWAGLRAREEGGWRLLAGPVDRLYHVTEDPGERRDVATEHPDIVRRLRDALEEEWSRRRRIAHTSEARNLDEQEVAALRSIGYVGGGGDVDEVDDAFDQGVDPESRMPELDGIYQAIVLMNTDPKACLDILHPILRRDPTNRIALETKGRAFLRLGRPAKARDALRAAATAGRCPVTVHLDLARAERALGDREGEREALRAALRIDPLSVPARQAQAVLLLDDRDYEGALARLTEALEIRPRAVASHFWIARVYEEMGRREDADRHWRRIIELQEDGPMVQAAREALNRVPREASP